MMEQKLKTKTNITAYIEIAPKVFANVVGKTELEWEFSVTSTNTFIDGVYLRVPDQTLNVVLNSNEIHPVTGEEIELEGKSFKVPIFDVSVDASEIKLGQVIEPIDILAFKSGTTVSFTS